MEQDAFHNRCYLVCPYISDPVIIGGNIVYTFVTPQIKNDKTAWIPCILTTGLNITTVLNNYFSVSISGNISWNSNELFQKQYQQTFGAGLVQVMQLL
mgnify:CR=1 FL=1